MNNIKGYEEFTNEEFNWKKAAAGAALVGSLSMPACKSPSYLYMDANKHQPIEMETSNSLCKVLKVKERKDHMILLLSTDEGDKKEIMLSSGLPIKEGDRLYLVIKGMFGHVIHKSGHYDLITDMWCKNK